MSGKKSRKSNSEKQPRRATQKKQLRRATKKSNPEEANVNAVRGEHLANNNLSLVKKRGKLIKQINIDDWTSVAERTRFSLSWTPRLGGLQAAQSSLLHFYGFCRDF